LATVPIYRGDAVLRRAGALNAHPLNRAPAARVNAADAQRLGLADGERVRVGDIATLPLVIDAAVPEGAVWIEAAHADTATLPPYGAALTLGKA
jgi:NADH-quinone oxidoreductase subunit G